MYDLNWVDYLIITICCLSILAGFYRGLFREVISLCTLVVAYVVATFYASSLALSFASTDTMQHATAGADSAQAVSSVTLGLSFGLLFIGTVIVGAIIGMLLNMILQHSILGIGNRLLGGIFGGGRGLLISLALIFLVQLTAFGSDEFWKKSQLVVASQPVIEWLGNRVSPELAHLKDKLSSSLG